MADRDTPAARNKLHKADKTHVLKVNSAIGCCLLAAAQAGRVGSAISEGISELKADEDLALVPPLLPVTLPGPPGGVPTVAPDPFVPTPFKVIRVPTGRALPVGAVLLISGVVLDTILSTIGMAQVQEFLQKVVSGIVEVLQAEASDCAECCRRKQLQQSNARGYLKLPGGVVQRPRL